MVSYEIINFIFFITYGSVYHARVLQYTKQERLARDKQSSLLVPLVSYEVKRLLNTAEIV